MYIYNYFIILLGVCVSYDTRFDTIHDVEKSKIVNVDNSEENFCEKIIAKDDDKIVLDGVD